jgi:hypothetical protein
VALSQGCEDWQQILVASLLSLHQRLISRYLTLMAKNSRQAKAEVAKAFFHLPIGTGDYAPG